MPLTEKSPQVVAKLAQLSAIGITPTADQVAKLVQQLETEMELKLELCPRTDDYHARINFSIGGSQYSDNIHVAKLEVLAKHAARILALCATVPADERSPKNPKPKAKK